MVASSVCSTEAVYTLVRTGTLVLLVLHVGLMPKSTRIASCRLEVQYLFFNKIILKLTFVGCGVDGAERREGVRGKETEV